MITIQAIRSSTARCADMAHITDSALADQLDDAFLTTDLSEAADLAREAAYRIRRRELRCAAMQSSSI
jgi:hypothetical protein